VSRPKAVKPGTMWLVAHSQTFILIAGRHLPVLAIFYWPIDVSYLAVLEWPDFYNNALSI